MVFIKGFKLDKKKIASSAQLRGKLDGPDDPRIENVVLLVLSEINQVSEYALDFRVGDGTDIFIVYDDGDDQAALEARELGPVEPIIWVMERQFLTGPAVWEIEEV
ncbi:hypothetical protein K443DRAFT_153114 [Laccaria amethystina LaAM-08-1]|uniref:Unplaced genomic scaffold K443scaffold_10, whole genome shotgun sequence n=1 Tax=Laccaria amethystina LaAM-08-1 TaxID=1095629 RepID=A0A0C9YC31_9AGAR|nr:hypothetical protein K443DRAFT_153114 [Laccaria amethystina LaAM-08-1]